MACAYLLGMAVGGTVAGVVAFFAYVAVWEIRRG